jgi:hypothetical protein
VLTVEHHGCVESRHRDSNPAAVLTKDSPSPEMPARSLSRDSNPAAALTRGSPSPDREAQAGDEIRTRSRSRTRGVLYRVSFTSEVILTGLEPVTPAMSRRRSPTELEDLEPPEAMKPEGALKLGRRESNPRLDGVRARCNASFCYTPALRFQVLSAWQFAHTSSHLATSSRTACLL